MAKHIIRNLLRFSTDLPNKSAFKFLDDNGKVYLDISFAELCYKIRHLGSHLKKNYTRQKKAILIYEDLPDFILAFFACQWAGITSIPVSFSRRNKLLERSQSIINDSQADIILSSVSLLAPLRHFCDQLSHVNIDIITTDDIGSSGDSLFCKPDLSNKISFIQYTSGSTGYPKGVIITSENLIDNQKALSKTFKTSKNAIIFSWLPFHHDMGLIGSIIHTIYTGASCILATPLYFLNKPIRWLQAISDFQVSHSGGPNFAYDLCLSKVKGTDLGKLDLSTWKVAYNGSEIVKSETLDNFASFFKPYGFNKRAFYPCYGLAEATLLVSGKKATTVAKTLHLYKTNYDDHFLGFSDEGSGLSRPFVSCGLVAPGFTVLILSPIHHQECRDFEEGEICISGKSVTRGYYNKSDDPNFISVNKVNYFKTGDLGFMVKGQLFLSGRLKELFIIRGKNYYPYDLEMEVSKCHPFIEKNSVAVFRLHTEEERFAVIAEIRRDKISNLPKNEILNVIEKCVISNFNISPHDIILTIPFGIPRTTSGKMQRALCGEYYTQRRLRVIASSRESLRPFLDDQPLGELIEKVKLNSSPELIKIYLLKRLSRITESEIDVNSDLEYVGLDSLKMAEFINIINRDLNIRIGFKDLLYENTLLSLINTIEGKLWLTTKEILGKDIII